MGYWKSKVAPKIKKIFDKDGKKAAAADFSKSFNKDEISKEVEEKKSELQPKVVVVYEAASAEIKTLVKERKQSGVKKHSLAVAKFLQELITIEFPGAKKVSEAAAASAPALVAGPVLFVFEKVSGFVVTEVPTAAAEAPVATEETASREVAAVVMGEKKHFMKTQELYALVFATRYLDIHSFCSLYNTVMKHTEQLYILNWIYRYFTEPHMSLDKYENLLITLPSLHIFTFDIIFHILNAGMFTVRQPDIRTRADALYADFFYYYFLAGRIMSSSSYPPELPSIFFRSFGVLSQYSMGEEFKARGEVN
ncbi:Plasma membrane-associated cation-binding protein 1 [Ananas comosus]|uniref:Plasma membrane-associated cation-binding protein 1 n=1 Tax=Ananas comosus TaxID=4615 RepID=A0A199VTZ9_ANACO|nr:Plasma membrane-associated cation-binding protein 1 [Ananas comosus]